MARRAAAAAIGCALLCAGCGSHSAAKSVSRYIDDVNAIQRGLTTPLADVSVRMRELSTGKKLDTLAPQLAKSAGTMRTLERRIDRLQPPPQAAKLDSLVRQSVHEEWGLANELALLAAYVGGAQPILAEAGAMGKRLRATMHDAKSRRADAAALDTYAAGLDSVAARLAKLRAPPLERPTQRGEVHTYNTVATRARALAKALLRGENGATQVHALEVAVASNATTAAQRARIAALVAFNRRVEHLRKLQTDVQRERDRLERTLGS